MSHRTVRCCTGQELFTIRCASDARSDFCAQCSRTVHTFADDRCAVSRCSAWCTGQSGGTSDSLVNYSGAAPEKPEGEEFRLSGPWCTGQSPVRQTRVLFGFFLLLSFEP
jgi:hypothetical protein